MFESILWFLKKKKEEKLHVTRFEKKKRKEKKEGNPFGKPLTRSYDGATEVTPKPVEVEAQRPPLNRRG